MNFFKNVLYTTGKYTERGGNNGLLIFFFKNFVLNTLVNHPVTC